MKSASGLISDLKINGWVQHKILMSRIWVLQPPLSPHRVRGIWGRRLTLDFSSSTDIDLVCDGILHGWVLVPGSSALFPDEQIYHCSVTLLSCARDGLLYARSSVLAFSFSPEEIQTCCITLTETPGKFMETEKQIHNLGPELAVFVYTSSMLLFDRNGHQCSLDFKWPEFNIGQLWVVPVSINGEG